MSLGFWCIALAGGSIITNVSGKNFYYLLYWLYICSTGCKNADALEKALFKNPFFLPKHCLDESEICSPEGEECK